VNKVQRLKSNTNENSKQDQSSMEEHEALSAPQSGRDKKSLNSHSHAVKQQIPLNRGKQRRSRGASKDSNMSEQRERTNQDIEMASQAAGPLSDQPPPTAQGKGAVTANFHERKMLLSTFDNDEPKEEPNFRSETEPQSDTMVIKLSGQTPTDEKSHLNTHRNIKSEQENEKHIAFDHIHHVHSYKVSPRENTQVISNPSLNSKNTNSNMMPISSNPMGGTSNADNDTQTFSPIQSIRVDKEARFADQNTSPYQNESIQAQDFALNTEAMHSFNKSLK